MLRVAVLELPASWGAPSSMLERVARELEHGGLTDLVLLPEASLTGYVSPVGVFDPSPFAEAIDGRTRARICEIARRHSTAIVAPLVLREEERVYNAMIGVDASGNLLFTYKKRRPWLPERWASADVAPPPVVSIGGVAVTIAICFDVHFLDEDAPAELRAADLLLFPSAWVEENDTRGDILSSLAQRYTTAIANANWGRGVVDVAGQGGSAIFDGAGRVVARVSTRLGAADALELEGERLPRADFTF